MARRESLFNGPPKRKLRLNRGGLHGGFSPQETTGSEPKGPLLKRRPILGATSPIFSPPWGSLYLPPRQTSGGHGNRSQRLFYQKRVFSPHGAEATLAPQQPPTASLPDPPPPLSLNRGAPLHRQTLSFTPAHKHGASFQPHPFAPFRGDVVPLSLTTVT